MKIEEKTILWKPVSEYTGGRVLATNGLDILIGELNPEGDCVSEDCSSIHLCGITHFAKIDGFFPELKESEDERIRKWLIAQLELKSDVNNSRELELMILKSIAWLEKQGEPTDINPSEFDLRLNKLLKRFETLPKEELASSLSFYLNVVQNDGTYREEKQGEQKPADKVEPKFKVGDYIERKDGLGCHAKIFHVGGNVYGCEKLIYPEDSSPFFDLMFKNQDEFKISPDFQKKPDKKVEPKFHEGEWMCENEPNDYTRFIQILEIVNVQGKERYRISRDIRNNEDIVEFDFIEKHFHKFDIKDAKDGDVLVTGDWVFIFKKLNTNDKPVCYCHYDVELGFAIDVNTYVSTVSTIKPATKEQRELLFKSMKDDGYEWDAEKLELKEIELKPIWNKNDENYMKSAIEMIMHCIWNSYRGLYKENVVEWLKSLKYRFAENNEELN